MTELSMLDIAAAAAAEQPAPIAEPIPRFEGEDIPDDDATGAK